MKPGEVDIEPQYMDSLESPDKALKKSIGPKSGEKLTMGQVKQKVPVIKVDIN